MPSEPGKKINVLFLSRWYPHRYDPMPGLFVERHAKAVANYCNVYVLYVHADKNLYLRHQVYFEDKGNYKVYKIYYPAVRTKTPIISNIKKGIKYLRFNLYGIKHIQQDGFKADIYHINILTRLGLVGLHQKMFKKTPYIITEHWSRYLPITNTYHGFLRKLLTRLIARNAGAVTTVTYNLKNAMIRHGIKNKNYHVIPNVVETSKYIAGEKIKSDKKIIVHISCFENRSKNISGILEVAKKLSKKRNDFIIKMIGEGIDLDAMIAKSKMDDTFDKTVFFTGLLENEALIKEL